MMLPAGGGDVVRPGVAVDIDPTRIERELAALWKPASEERGGEGAVVRACLTNLVVYVASDADLARATDVLTRVFLRHPNRTLLLVDGVEGGDGAAGRAADARRRSRLEASLTTLCSVAAGKSAPVCCERITLRAARGEGALFEGAVPALLVPDIPVVLWWTAGFDAPLLAGLSRFADRVVIDSRAAPPESGALASIHGLLEAGKLHDVVDLAWRGLGSWRHAVADLFDEPPIRALAPDLCCLDVEHRGRGRSAPAALLCGWVAARLGWEVEGTPGRDETRIRAPSGRRGRVRVRPAAGGGAAAVADGAPLSLRLATGPPDDPGGAFVSIALDPCQARCARLDFCTADRCTLARVMPFPPLDEAELLGEVLDTPPHPRMLRQTLLMAVALGV